MGRFDSLLGAVVTPTDHIPLSRCSGLGQFFSSFAAYPVFSNRDSWQLHGESALVSLEKDSEIGCAMRPFGKVSKMNYLYLHHTDQ